MHNIRGGEGMQPPVFVYKKGNELTSLSCVLLRRGFSLSLSLSLSRSSAWGLRSQHPISFTCSKLSTKPL